MALLIDTVLRLVQQEYRLPAPTWTDDPAVRLTEKETALLERECRAESEFDPNQTRREMWEGWKAGQFQGVLRRCAYGQVFAVLDTAYSAEDIPWDLWGRILRLYTEGRQKAPFCIYLFAKDRPRRFPRSPASPILPTNINGGYTYPCQKEAILIYRAEDATRVLIHELQHASCLDHPQLGIDCVEAETEAWAELWYVALYSKGNPNTFQRGLRCQSAWMLAQNKKVRRWIGETRAFPWRYTVGKEDVWRRWGILIEEVPRQPAAEASLRLTVPLGKSSMS